MPFTEDQHPVHRGRRFAGRCPPCGAAWCRPAQSGSPRPSPAHCVPRGAPLGGDPRQRPRVCGQARVAFWGRAGPPMPGAGIGALPLLFPLAQARPVRARHLPALTPGRAYSEPSPKGPAGPVSCGPRARPLAARPGSRRVRAGSPPAAGQPRRAHPQQRASAVTTSPVPGGVPRPPGAARASREPRSSALRRRHMSSCAAAMALSPRGPQPGNGRWEALVVLHRRQVTERHNIERTNRRWRFFRRAGLPGFVAWECCCVRSWVAGLRRHDGVLAAVCGVRAGR